MLQSLNFMIQTLLSSFLWCILNQSFSMQSIIIGAIIGALSYVFSRGMLGSSKEHPMYISLFFQLYKFPLLIFNIFKSGLKVIPYLFGSKFQVQVITHSTDTNDKLHNTFIANGITLTPGTVALDLQNQKLLVLTLVPNKERRKDT